MANYRFSYVISPSEPSNIPKNQSFNPPSDLLFSYYITPIPDISKIPEKFFTFYYIHYLHKPKTGEKKGGQQWLLGRKRKTIVFTTFLPFPSHAKYQLRVFLCNDRDGDRTHACFRKLEPKIRSVPLVASVSKQSMSKIWT